MMFYDEVFLSTALFTGGIILSGRSLGAQARRKSSQLQRIVEQPTQVAVHLAAMFPSLFRSGAQ